MVMFLSIIPQSSLKVASRLSQRENVSASRSLKVRKVRQRRMLKGCKHDTHLDNRALQFLQGFFFSRLQHS